MKAKLSELATAYEKPVALYPDDELPRKILEGVSAQRVRIVKLCRFTDILSPSFVSDGRSLAVLEALVRSPVERVILTTKGVPDERIIGLISRNKDRFSYNAAARPEQGLPLEPGLRTAGERLSAAEKLRRAGVQTTVHLDPVVAGIDDAPEVLEPFLKGLKKKGLRRVMFSYLLLTDEIAGLLREKLPREPSDRLLAAYDVDRRAAILPRQADTVSFATRPELKRRSVDAIAKLLRGYGFEFVLCSLKSTPGKERREYKDCPVCDGTFYA